MWGFYDAIVVGGSYAGLSAALQLVRARRRVLVVDAGRSRNRFARTALALFAHAAHAPGLVPAAYVWAGHIGFDGALGYGLKYATAFGDTHLGRGDRS